MKRARSRICGLAFALAAALSGCASPPSQFYILAATARPEAGASPAAYAVAVDSIGLPATVDRPQFVVQKGPNRVAFDEFNRWAAPLQNSIGRVIAENLVAMLGTPRVVLFSQTLGAEVDYRAAIEVQRFESAPGEAASLDAERLPGRRREGRRDARHARCGRHHAGADARRSRRGLSADRASQRGVAAVRPLAGALVALSAS